MPQEPRDFAQWTKSVERRLQQALRAGQSPQAVRLARELSDVQGQVSDNARQPAAPVELVVQTRVLPDLTGTPRGEVSVGFAPVTVSVDAEPIDVDRYELWLKELKDESEEEEDPNDDSWRTNLAEDTDPTYWGGREAPRTKQVADLEGGVDFVAGDRIRFTVLGDTYGIHPLEGFNELEHSVRLSAYRKVYEGDPMPWDIEEEEEGYEQPGEGEGDYEDKDGESSDEPEEDLRDFEVVEHANWKIARLPSGYQGGGSDRAVETYTVEGVVPKGTTRITAHIAVTIRVGYSEFVNPVIVNMSEERPDRSSEGTKMVSTSLEPEVAYSPLKVSGRYEVSVRAVAAGRPGPFSATRTVTVVSDKTPPPIPSDLELSSSGATVTASWDLLSGSGDPMPLDFSHTEVAYGYLPPPTGIAGSITLLFSQYIFETPAPPSDADFDGTWYFRHRAVDTSGNKSPWSATTSIVPKSLVDEAALRFELEEFNRERIDPLQDSINDEVKKAQDSIQSLRDQWDEEWDREEIDSLIERQQTFQKDLTEGFADADEKIRSLGVGDLFVENAIKAQAIDMESLTADRGFIDRAFVRLIEGELANYDQGIIGGVLLKDNSVSAKHLTIADLENMLPEEALWDFRENGLSSGVWLSGGGSANGWLTFTDQAQGPIVIRYEASSHTSSGQSSLRFAPTGRGVPVNPGDSFYVSAETWVNSGSAGYLKFRARYTDDSGGNVFWQDIGEISTNNTKHSWTVPDNTNRRLMDFVFWADSGGSGNAHIGRIQFRRQHAGKMIVDGLLQATTAELQELFFDTAVGNSIAAGAGRFLTIETGNLAANAVTADKLNFGSLNGALITGLQIQTHTNNRGVKITSAGIRAFNSSGTEVFTVNASNGNVSARGGAFTGASFEGGTVTGATITGGQFRTASSIFGSSNGGVRIQGDDSGGRIDVTDSSGSLVLRAGDTGAEIRGHIEARSMDLSGALRVGGNGEGGIVPDGNRTRFVGRTPRTTSPDDTMAYGRTGTLTWSPGSNPIYIRVTYETPSSLGRTPLATLHTTNNIFRRNGGGFTVTTGERGSARFTIRVQHGGGWDTTIQGWTSYLAYLGDPPNSGGSVET